MFKDHSKIHAPRTGAWIEMDSYFVVAEFVAPNTGARIEINPTEVRYYWAKTYVAPYMGARVKF